MGIEPAIGDLLILALPGEEVEEIDDDSRGHQDLEVVVLPVVDEVGGHRVEVQVDGRITGLGIAVLVAGAGLFGTFGVAVLAADVLEFLLVQELLLHGGLGLVIRVDLNLAGLVVTGWKEKKGF